MGKASRGKRRAAGERPTGVGQATVAVDYLQRLRSDQCLHCGEERDLPGVWCRRCVKNGSERERWTASRPLTRRPAYAGADFGACFRALEAELARLIEIDEQGRAAA